MSRSTSSRVDLISIGGPPRARWANGECYVVAADPSAVAEELSSICGINEVGAVMLLSAGARLPSERVVEDLLSGPGDAWHVGLSAGQSGLPEILNYIQPTWSLSADAPPDSGSTSWRLALAPALVRTDVIRQLGTIDHTFDTMAGAGLEWGLRMVRRGALVRHEPRLVEAMGDSDGVPPTFADQVRVVLPHFPLIWTRWAALRLLARRGVRGPGVPAGLRLLVGPRQAETRVYARSIHEQGPAENARPRISVLVPTIDRYPYLRTLLSQLESQTLEPLEVIVVDQTPRGRRADDVANWAPELDAVVIDLDSPGQCRARNLGLQASRGDYVLFLDDDDEIPPDLLECHYSALVAYGADATCGHVEDTFDNPLDTKGHIRRVSDVFSTNNALLRKDALRASGLFDPAFDHGARADADLGIRLHLSGSYLLYEPDASVLHHHAPRGGLRTHGARRVTGGTSRNSITQRHLRSATEQYLEYRYFTPDQVAESRGVALLASFRHRGSPLERFLKMLVALGRLPDSISTQNRAGREARRMLANRMPIPELEPPAGAGA